MRKALLVGLASVGAVLVAGVAAVCLSGCANLGYYWQSAVGHLGIMNAARPVDDWLQDDATPARVRDKLELARRIRAFASGELALPDNPSYRRYADLRRPAAVWNVVAAPPYSLKLKTWCFPVTGCVGYRGYYDPAKAQAEAEALAAQGLEASVYPVPAYSTLGYMNWAGGDPLLSTFIHYPEGELARLIFHELAHQVVYAKNDTMFNESFATAVERLGGERWLAQASPKAREDYAAFDARRRQFRELTRSTRKRLAQIYGEAEDLPAPPAAERAALKAEAMREFRQRYEQLRAGWGGDPARWRLYDQWVARANNALFGTQAAYDELVPGFEALFEREGRDWKRFHDAVRRLADLPKDERHRILKSLAS